MSAGDRQCDAPLCTGRNLSSFISSHVVHDSTYCLLDQFLKDQTICNIVSLYICSGSTTISLSFGSGDSYSSVQRAYSDTHQPSVEHPLGLPFPGSTFNFPDANWVGYLIKEYGPEPRFQPGATPSVAYEERPYLVHDYARGGDTVDGIRRQVEQEYLPGVGQKPEWAPWTPEETLFGESNLAVGVRSQLIIISYLGRDQRLRVSFV